MKYNKNSKYQTLAEHRPEINWGSGERAFDETDFRSLPNYMTIFAAENPGNVKRSVWAIVCSPPFCNRFAGFWSLSFSFFILLYFQDLHSILTYRYGQDVFRRLVSLLKKHPTQLLVTVMNHDLHYTRSHSRHHVTQECCFDSDCHITRKHIYSHACIHTSVKLAEWLPAAGKPHGVCKCDEREVKARLPCKCNGDLKDEGYKQTHGMRLP